MSTLPDILFFGAWRHRGSGHGLHGPSGHHVDPRNKELPCGLDLLDTGFAPNDPNQAEGIPAIVHRKGWTLVAWWDRADDKRWNANSVLLMRGAHGLGEVLARAREAFPEIAYRFPREQAKPLAIQSFTGAKPTIAGHLTAAPDIRMSESAAEGLQESINQAQDVVFKVLRLVGVTPKPLSEPRAQEGYSLKRDFVPQLEALTENLKQLEDTLRSPRVRDVTIRHLSPMQLAGISHALDTIQRERGNIGQELPVIDRTTCVMDDLDEAPPTPEEAAAIRKAWSANLKPKKDASDT